MVRPRDRAGKRKATSPTTTPELEEDVAALRQHMRPAREQRSKARAEKIAHSSRGRGLPKRASPPPKRTRVIEFTSSEDEAIPVAEDSGGAPEKEQSTRYVFTLLHTSNPFLVSLGLWRTVVLGRKYNSESQTPSNFPQVVDLCSDPVADNVNLDN